MKRWSMAVAEQHDFSGEFRLRAAEGVERWVHACAKALGGGEGRFVGYIGTLTDITGRKELDQVKDDLVSTVSHELRTPLASLRGFVELLLQRDFPLEKRVQFLTIMHEESLRLTRLIDAFLDLQRMASGRQTYNFETLDIVAFLQDRMALFAGEGACLRIMVDESLPPVCADADRLHQVLTNLISNAQKFSPPGSAITLEARRQEREVLLQVTDQGAGIPPDALPRLFHKFFRVDNGETKKVGGTGLGLAVVKEIVEAHQGRIWVKSEVGTGSTFFFTLPIVHIAALNEWCNDSPLHCESRRVR